MAGATKDQLYSAALSWFGTAFRSAKATIDVADAAGGRIVAKPLIPFEPAALSGSACTRGFIGYTVSVAVKDGRYRYEIGPFFHSPQPVGNNLCGMANCNYGEITDAPKWNGKMCSAFGGDSKNWARLQTLTHAEITSLSKSLREAMTKAPKDNW